MQKEGSRGGVCIWGAAASRAASMRTMTCPGATDGLGLGRVALPFGSGRYQRDQGIAEGRLGHGGSRGGSMDDHLHGEGGIMPRHDHVHAQGQCERDQGRQ